MPKRETRRARADARQAREDRAREDYHDPIAGFGGAAPARSALTLRLVLASFGLVTCGLGAAAFLIVTNAPALAGILAFLAAVAAADIVVVARRKLRGEPG
ncbi:MAG: hypothetical protein QOG05_4349 [Streptosporangiaceae bacterium]|jgi:hypothetical protein|nr:hypothetical protein [Streptosporangiaceae bacterium]